jgi:hypothetical protein
MIIGSIVGACVFASIGYLFGAFAFQELGWDKTFPAFDDRQGSGAMFAWLIGIFGLPIGARWGRAFKHYQDKRQRQQQWRDSHPEQYAEYLEEKAEAKRRRKDWQQKTRM